MNRHEFSKAYAQKAGITQESSAKTCEEIFDFLFDCINENDRVYIKGLGTFTHATRKPRKVGNLKGGDPIVIPAKDDIKFLPYQGSESVPPDPMATTTYQISEATLLSQAVATSLSTLGLPEFLKRIALITAATPNDISTISQRETTRATKLTCPCCGKEFYKRFAHQRFCSGRCREENARRARTEFSAYEYDNKAAGGKNVTINL